MTAAAEPTSPSTSSLQAALLDYFSAPGKYQLSLRQPAPLFASVREILQIAAGRGDLPAGQAERLREAAAFFIRAALLYPGADHYAVLGLPARTEPVELKERYRLLMRLIHPDFTPAGSAWPADAAVRVNRANEVLSSPVLRKEYDEQLASLHSHRAAEAAMVNAHRSAARMRTQERTWHLNHKAVWALGGASIAVVVFMLMPAPESTDLVQKAATPIPRMPPAAVAEPTRPADPSNAATLIPGDVLARARPAAVITGTPAPLPPAARPFPSARHEARPEPAAPARQAAAPQNPAARMLPVAPATPIRIQAEDAPVVVVAPQAAPPQPAPIPVAAAAAAVASLPPVVTARAVVTPAVAVLPSPTLADAQPVLSQLLQMLETGRGEQLLRLLDPESRRAPSAQALSQQYDQLVRGSRPVRLSHVDFKGEARDGVLLVTGRIRLHAGEPTIGSHGERLLLRAEFMSRGGKVLLTGLSGASD